MCLSFSVLYIIFTHTLLTSILSRGVDRQSNRSRWEIFITNWHFH